MNAAVPRKGTGHSRAVTTDVRDQSLKAGCDSNSGTIHWKFEQMIAHVSTDETVRPGEILGSGTVGGGSGAERGTLLQRDHVVELEVERLGTLRNRVI